MNTNSAADGHHNGAGVRRLHVAVDDRSRVCFAELLDDERRASCVGFLRRATAFYASLGVRVREAMTDNGPAYRSRAFAGELARLGAGHVFAGPYSPWQNGKVERMDQTVSVNLFPSYVALLSFSLGNEGFHVWQGAPYWVSSWTAPGVPSESSPSSWWVRRTRRGDRGG